MYLSRTGEFECAPFQGWGIRGHIRCRAPRRRCYGRAAPPCRPGQSGGSAEGSDRIQAVMCYSMRDWERWKQAVPREACLSVQRPRAAPGAARTAAEDAQLVPSPRLPDDGPGLPQAPSAPLVGAEGGGSGPSKTRAPSWRSPEPTGDGKRPRC